MTRGDQPASEMTIRERMAMELGKKWLDEWSIYEDEEQWAYDVIGLTDALLAALEKEQGE